MASNMIKALKGQVLADLSKVHKEALQRAPKPTVDPTANDGAPVDKEGSRFTNRMAQDRMEGGFGFVMTANSVGDNHFAREQTAAFKRAHEHKLDTERTALGGFEADRARAASQNLEKERAASEEDAKQAKSFAWGAKSLGKPKRAGGAAEPEEADNATKRRKTAAAGEAGEAAAAAKPAAALAGLGIGDYGSSSSDSEDD